MEQHKVARFYLPARCLRDALTGDFGSALDALEDARRACAPSAQAEAALDIGTQLLEVAANRATLERFARIDRDEVGAAHLGIRHKLDDVDAEIFRRLGDNERARACLVRSTTQLERLLSQLPDSYRDRLAGHPWSESIRRVRSVP
jgi:hypothetical protein